MVGRHAELIASCRRDGAAGNLTRVCGIRLLHLNRGPGPAKTYRAYIRCRRSADLPGRTVAGSTLTDLQRDPGSFDGLDAGR
jgi:hypothetical protein